MKRRRRGTKKKTKVEGKKKKRTMNGSICMVNAVARAEEKTRAEKSHRRWRRGKKGAKKARFRRAWRAKKKERHTVYCVERGRWWSGERRKKRGDGLHKNTGYEMQNQHTLMRGCVSRTSGWKIDTIGYES